LQSPKSCRTTSAKDTALRVLRSPDRASRVASPRLWRPQWLTCIEAATVFCAVEREPLPPGHVFAGSPHRMKLPNACDGVPSGEASGYFSSAAPKDSAAQDWNRFCVLSGGFKGEEKVEVLKVIGRLEQHQRTSAARQDGTKDSVLFFLFIVRCPRFPLGVRRCLIFRHCATGLSPGYSVPSCCGTQRFDGWPCWSCWLR